MSQEYMWVLPFVPSALIIMQTMERLVWQTKYKAPLRLAMLIALLLPISTSAVRDAIIETAVETYEAASSQWPRIVAHLAFWDK